MRKGKNEMMVGKPALLAAGMLVVASLMVSCPNSFLPEMVEQMSDTEAPVITILSPEDRSQYSTVVEVRGTLSDNAAVEGGETAYSGTKYSVVGSPIENSFTPDSNGSFVFQFTTREPDGTPIVSGLLTLVIQATDWNGNTTQKTLQLVQIEDGDITNFKAVPGNGEVLLSWDGIPTAERYTVTETKITGLSITTSETTYRWNELNNGEIYSFQVTAVIPDEIADDAVSKNLRAMPLSDRFFAPKVREKGHGSITIEWVNSTAVKEFVVERSTSASGPWSLRATIEGYVFTDDTLLQDIPYWYRIYPLEFPDIVSDSISDTAGFPGRNPVYTARMPGKDIRDIGFHNGILYQLSQDNLLLAWNTTSTGNPVLLNTLALDSKGQDIAFYGNYAYITRRSDGSSNFSVIDISDPANPEPVRTILVGGTGEHAGAVAISPNGNLAAVATGNRIAIYELTDPENPVFRGTPISGSWFTAVQFSSDSNYLYYSEKRGYDTAHFGVFSIPAPAGPYTQSTVLALGSGMIYSIAENGNSVYASGATIDAEQGVAVINAADKLNPVASLLETAEPTISLSLEGTTLYCNIYSLATNTYEIAIYNAETALTPRIIGNHSLPSYCEDIVTANGSVFAALGSYGTAKVDVRVPKLHLVTSLDLSPMEVNDLVLSGNTALAYNGNYSAYGANLGPALINLASPSDPTLITTLSYDQLTDIAPTGSRYFAGADARGLISFTFSDTGEMDIQAEADQETLYYNGNHISLMGEQAYLLDTLRRLSSFNIATSDAISFMDHLPTVDGGAMLVTENRAILQSYSNITFVDITNPAKLRVTNTLSLTDLGSSVYSIAISRNYLWLAGDRDLTSVFLDHPDTAIQRGRTAFSSVSGTVEKLEIIGDFAFVAGRNRGTIIVDVSDPEDPLVVSYGPEDIPLDVSSLALNGSTLLAANGIRKNLLVYEIILEAP
jgi:hypothetical protein